MADPRWERIKALFAAALDTPAADRSVFLERECGGDDELRREVESLLSARSLSAVRTAGAAHALGSDTGGGSSGATTQSAPLSEGPGTRIGPYKLLQLIGEGGFGSVFMAEQERPVRRRVALKIIKLGMDTRAVIARFEAERQALAMMDHPNIAKVLDAGATESGRPYFVMELVRGVPITEYCDGANLTAAERLALVIPVCQAVQHAHQKGIIHRDLKPSNILVTLHDGKPVPKVIDFGIAKATASRLTEKTLFTEHRQMIGTPAYMSPEQAEMSGLDIDTRADVYSLGVLLYELLTGATPFDTRQLLERGYAEIQRVIREVEPQKPSTRVSTMGEGLAGIAARRKVEPRRLGVLLRGDLDWIVMKALEKDRTRRYDTAVGLAEDIGRHLRGEAVQAAPASVGYRVRKFVRRNRGKVVAGAAIATALLLGLVGTGVGLGRAHAANLKLSDQATQVRHTLEDLAALQYPEPGTTGADQAKARRDGARFAITNILKQKPPADSDLDLYLLSTTALEQTKKLLATNTAALQHLKHIAVSAFMGPDPDGSAPLLMEYLLTGGEKFLVYLPGSRDPNHERGLIIIDPAAHPGVTIGLENVDRLPPSSVAADKVAEVLTLLVQQASDALREESEELKKEVKRARLAQAQITVGELEHADNMFDPLYKSLDVNEAVAATTEYLGRSAVDTVRAEWQLACRDGISGALWVSRLRDWDARRAEATDRPREIDLRLWSSLAQDAWARRDADQCIGYVRQIGHGLPGAALHDPRSPIEVYRFGYGVDTLIDAREDLVQEWSRLDSGATAASFYRDIALRGQETERSAAIDKAEALDAQAGLSPHPATLAAKAALLAETAHEDAVRYLNQARALLKDERWTSDAESIRLVTLADEAVEPKPGAEERLADETRRRRLAEADLVMQRQLQPSEEPTYVFPTIEELRTAYDSRKEYCGADAASTIEAEFAIATRARPSSAESLALLRDAVARAGRSPEMSTARLVEMLSEASVLHEIALDFEYADSVSATLADAVQRLAQERRAHPAPSGGPRPVICQSILISQTAPESPDDLEALANKLRDRRGAALRASVVQELHERSTNISTPPGVSEYARDAEYFATQALSADPHCGACATALALAKFRLGDYQGAMSAAENATGLLERAGTNPDPLHLATLAMIHAKLHNTDKAGSTLARLRDLMSDPKNAGSWALDVQAQSLLKEAEALIDPPKK